MTIVSLAISSMWSNFLTYVFSERTIASSEISVAWSPIRSISVTILRAAEIFRRSLATGCCCNKRRKHKSSIFLSVRSISSSPAITFWASSTSCCINAFTASPMDSSIIVPMLIISLLSCFSCSSKRIRISTKPPCDVILCTFVLWHRE